MSARTELSHVLNHAKIIAVDGKVLITGGHNFWDQHYLKTAPVHDLSIRLRGHRLTTHTTLSIRCGHTLVPLLVVV